MEQNTHEKIKFTMNWNVRSKDKNSITDIVKDQVLGQQKISCLGMLSQGKLDIKWALLSSLVQILFAGSKVKFAASMRKDHAISYQSLIHTNNSFLELINSSKNLLVSSYRKWIRYPLKLGIAQSSWQALIHEKAIEKCHLETIQISMHPASNRKLFANNWATETEMKKSWYVAVDNICTMICKLETLTILREFGTTRQ